MKKTLLMVAVIGLLFLSVGPAKAGEAWVLWSNTYFSTGEGGRWIIEEAFPSYDLCKQFMIKWSNNLRDVKEGKDKYWLEVGPHEFSHQLKDSVMLLQFKCLPESVDPRK